MAGTRDSAEVGTRSLEENGNWGTCLDEIQSRITVPSLNPHESVIILNNIFKKSERIKMEIRNERENRIHDNLENPNPFAHIHWREK